MEAELEFTSIRANSLVNAGKIDLPINGEVKADIVVNESRLKELRKLRRYYPSGIINQQAATQERIDLIWQPRKAHETISARMIRESGEKVMKDPPKQRQAKISMSKCEAALKKAWRPP